MGIGQTILDLLNAVFGFWNSQVAIVFSLLGQSPESFQGGGAWAYIESVEPYFVAIGSSLVVLFFVIGFCSESVSLPDEFRFENILRIIIRLAISEWLVVNNISILEAIFTSCGNLVNLLGGTSAQTLKIADDAAETIKNLDVISGILFIILAAILSLVIIVCGLYLIYLVYFRFLKLFLVVPLGALAFSTVGSSRGLAQVGISYAKYFFSVAFEAVVIAMAILVCNAFLSSGLPEFAGDYEAWTKTLIYLAEMTFTIAVTVGAVKGAQTLTQRAFGV
jgi:hypothetical protein